MGTERLREWVLVRAWHKTIFLLSEIEHRKNYTRVVLEYTRWRGASSSPVRSARTPGGGKRNISLRDLRVIFSMTSSGTA